jgi:hypothetical protein
MMDWPNHYPTLSAALPSPALRILSLGGGVQSTTLYHAACRGDVGPKPDCAIFANPGWEGERLEQHIANLQARGSIPIHIVSAGNIKEEIFTGRSERSGRFSSIPFFIKAPDGKVGMGKRQCTAHYKLEPIKRKVRELLGVGPRQRIAPDSVEMWIGISTDEIVRMVPSRVKYIRNRFPLVEADMNRRRCERWLMERQEQASKSACLCCPYRSDREWRDLRDNAPDEFAEVVEADTLIRRGGSTFALRGEQFMHSSCVPLGEVNFDKIDVDAPSLFNNECMGLCWS